jgi:hypothetical protein
MNGFTQHPRHVPTGNTERQRQFRERNPGYYRNSERARRRKATDARLAAEFAFAMSLRQTAIAPRAQLMLPAPVETIELPGLMPGLQTIEYAMAEVVNLQTPNPATSTCRANAV